MEKSCIGQIWVWHKKKMKVLYFTRDYNAHDQRFLTALSRTDWDVYLLRLESNPYTPLPRVYPDRVREVLWRGGYELFDWDRQAEYIEDFKRVLSALKPDVVHAGPVHTCAYLAAQAGFTPLVTMSWSSDILYEPRFNSALVGRSQFALDHTRILVGDCEAMAAKAEKEYGFPRDRMVLFPWGVDLNLFHPEGTRSIRQALGWRDKRVFLCLRSWEPVYGVDLALQAFGTLAQKNPDVRLLLYGNGSQKPLVDELIQRYGLEEKVHIGGKVRNADLPDIYRSADVYLTAAHSDGSSVSLMEAMASGLPSIVSDIPGNLEWIDDGVEGLVFPDGEADRMFQKMEIMLHDSSRLTHMGESARKKAEEKADWNKNFPALLTAYQRAMEGMHA